MNEMVSNIENNTPYLMLYGGIGILLGVALFAVWVAYYRVVGPSRGPSPYPNLFLGEDPWKRKQ